MEETRSELAQFGSMIFSRLARCRTLFAGLLTILIVGTLAANTRPRSLAMWSWKSADGAWNFAVLPDRNVPPYWSNEEVLHATALKGAGSLKRYLSSLPPGTNVVWRNLPPNHILIYPSKPMIANIVQFAKRHGVNIEVWPTLNE